MLEERGLGRYADADVVRVAEMEIAEAYNLTPEEMDVAAVNLLRRTSSPRYYDHMGGVGPHEVKDYNQYSNSGLLKPVEIQDYHSDYSDGEIPRSPRSRVPSPQPMPSVTHADDLMYVTTL